MIDLRFQSEVLQRSGVPRDEALRRVVRTAAADPRAVVDWPGASLVLSSLGEIRDAMGKTDSPNDSMLQEGKRLVNWIGRVISAVRRLEVQGPSIAPPANRREPIAGIVRQLLDEFLADYPFADKIDREAVADQVVRALYAETGPAQGQTPPAGQSNVAPNARAGGAAVAASLSRGAECRYADRRAAAQAELDAIYAESRRKQAAEQARAKAAEDRESLLLAGQLVSEGRDIQRRRQAATARRPAVSPGIDPLHFTRAPLPDGLR